LSANWDTFGSAKHGTIDTALGASQHAANRKTLKATHFKAFRAAVESTLQHALDAANDLAEHPTQQQTVDAAQCASFCSAIMCTNGAAVCYAEHATV